MPNTRTNTSGYEIRDTVRGPRRVHVAGTPTVAAAAAAQRAESNGYEIRRQSGYHGSSFASYKLYTSDRYEEIQMTSNGFRRANGKPLPPCIGFEIETGSTGINNDDTLTEIMLNYCIPASGFDRDFFRAEHDGSLRGNSSGEFITQTTTIAGIRNRYPAFKVLWDKFFVNLGIMPNSSCGMHVNLSNATFGSTPEKREKTVRKLAYLINGPLWDLVRTGVNRAENQTGYCDRMTCYRTADRCKTGELYTGNSHYISFNLGHYANGSDGGRVEIRLVGPQTSYACFRNTVEFVLWLVNVAKTLSWEDLDNKVKVFSGCNFHVWDRLKSNIYRGGYITREELEAIKPTVKREERYI